MQYDTIRHKSIQYSTAQYNTVEHNTIEHNRIEHNTIQHNTIQHNTNQYNTIGAFGNVTMPVAHVAEARGAAWVATAHRKARHRHHLHYGLAELTGTEEARMGRASANIITRNIIKYKINTILLYNNNIS